MRNRNGMRALVAALLVAACSDTPAEMEPDVLSVTVAPAGPVLQVGDTVRLTAYPKVADGTVVDGMTVAWESESDDVASIHGNGASAVVLARAPGRTRIQAMVNGRAGNVEVVVQSPPATVASVEVVGWPGPLQVGDDRLVEAVLRAHDGTILAGRTAQWSTSDPAVATVTPYENGLYGVVRGTGAGVVTVRAEVAGIAGTTTIQVNDVARPVATIMLMPEPGTLVAGTSVDVTAVLFDANGAVVTGRPVTWSTSNALVLSVTQQGDAPTVILQARAGGTATLAVEAGAVRREFTVQVMTPVPPPPPTPVAYVMVQPQNEGMWELQTKTYTAVALSQSGAQLSGRPITWSVEDPQVAQVDSAGHVHAKAPGTTRVFAESGGVRGVGQLTVHATSQQMTFALTYDWRDGQIRWGVAMATMPWTDADGATRDVILYAHAGTFTIDRSNGTYVRTIDAQGHALVDGVLRPVVTKTFTDSGAMFYRWDPLTDGATTFDFVSATTPGLVTHGAFRRGGELLVAVPGLGGQLTDMLFRMQ